MSIIIEQNIFILLALAGVLGLIIGSFLNVVIYRLPVMLNNLWYKECTNYLQEQKGIELPELSGPKPKLNLASPASHCPHCRHSLGILENIPVLSYICQRGKCKHCNKSIGARYVIVELVCAALTMATVFVLGLTWVTWLALILTWALITLSFIDIDHHILPDDITLSFLWLGLFINSLFVMATPSAAILGAITGYLSFWIVYQLFKLLTGKEGMGHGDFKLMALLGAWLGWQAIPLIIILSSFIGALIGLGLILFRGHDKSKPMPFGPYIALAGWIALLWGDIIISKYFHYIGIQVTL